MTSVPSPSRVCQSIVPPIQARSQTVGSNLFTSARLDTRNKVQVIRQFEQTGSAAQRWLPSSDSSSAY